MKRATRAILLLAMLASACGTGSTPDAADTEQGTTTESAAQTTTTAVTAAATETTTARTTTTVVQHPFNEYVAAELGMEEMTVQDATGEWLDWLSPAEGVAAWYCTGQFPALNSMWSYGFNGDSPKALETFDSWQAVFWDVADEMVCSGSPAGQAASTTTSAPAVATDDLAAQLVSFFYPGYELDFAVSDDTNASSIRLVGKSMANPGFQIGFDAFRSDVASDGCDFVYKPTGETWCHSTAPSGLEMLAGRQPMVPASHLAGIEADLSDLDLVVTDFQLNSNVAITLLGIAQGSVEGWDGVSSEQAIGMSLDIASGTWRRN